MAALLGTIAACANTASDRVLLGQICEDGTTDCFLGGSTGSGGTSGTTTNPDCIPNQTASSLEDSCGVFVSASKGNDASGDGTKENPFATLGKSILLAKGKPIYACADATKPFSEAVEFDGDANVFGGLDCATWKYTGAKTTWTAGADEVPLTAANGSSIALQDMAIEAADAMKDGCSSIAVLAAASTTLTLARCDVTAGNGKDGATPDAPMGTGMAGVPGDKGLDGCIDIMGKLGGNGGALTCDGTDVGGGPGGNGVNAATGGAGSPGQPENMTNGLGGSGQKETPATACTPGGDGAEGLPGDPGAGATTKGSLSATGYKGEDGADGATSGKPGQGGGGGGGAKKCGVNAGPSAGGGGSGGCGGAVGKGGQAGGASIAIVSAGAKLVLSDVKITAKSGGKGGDGGAGQAGGDGGIGGMPGAGDATSIACSGGKGGKGGAGGRGGGGLGGHSIGIAHTGEAPDLKDPTIKITIAKAGDGGMGDGANGIGAAGIAKEVQVF